VRLGPGLAASCPLLCIARTDESGSPDALPLQISNLQFDALVYISQAFVKVQLLAQYPPISGYEDRPLWLFLPKTAEAVVTDVSVENMGRGAVFAVAVVPKEDTARFGAYGGSFAGGSFAGGSFTGGGDGGGGDGGEAETRDPELFALPLSPGVPGGVAPAARSGGVALLGLSSVVPWARGACACDKQALGASVGGVASKALPPCRHRRPRHQVTSSG
jgi:hypothetical protein